MLVYFVYCVFALMIAVSLRRPVGALTEARRQRANLDRELRALAAAEPAMSAEPEHLTPSLARLFEETRLLQVALEEPLQASRAWLASDRSPWLARVDVGDGSDLDRLGEVDMSLVNARRAVWDWLATVEALPDEDQQTLVRLGLSVGVVRHAIEERDAFQRTSAMARRETARIEKQIVGVRAALGRYETGLARATPTSLYR